MLLAELRWRPEDLEIDVRNPNPKVVNVIDTIIQPGATWNRNFTLAGMAGTNKGVLEISSIPPLNLEKRLNYLIEYPYGCIKQPASSVFPQLYLPNLMGLSTITKAKIETNIKAAIVRLQIFPAFQWRIGLLAGFKICR